MDLDRAFIAALVSAGKPGLKTLIEKGIDETLLRDECKNVLAFILDYNSTYSEFPHKEVIEAKLGFPIPPPQGKVAFFADELLNRRLYERLKDGVQGLAKALEGHDPLGGLEGLEGLVFNVRKLRADQARVQSLPALGKDVWDYYQRIKGGERGIPTPWQTINEETLGFWPEDLVLFCARAGVGKCVRANTEIVDPVSGVPRTIEELYQDASTTEVVTWSKEKGIHASSITAKHDTGYKTCLKFTLSSGRSIEVTPEHPFLTPEGWKRADEIKPGYTVGIPAKMPLPTKPAPMALHEIFGAATMLAKDVQAALVGVPEGIWRLNSEQLMEFVVRLYGLTAIGDRPLTFKLLSEKLGIHLQSLLLRLGLQSRIACVDAFWEVQVVPSSSDCDIFWDTVVDVKDTGIHKIYDLTVEPTSCFVANDIIVHNTWLTVILANCFWNAGKRVLYVTTEMSQLRVAMRFYALKYKINYDDLRKGRLGEFAEQEFKSYIDEMGLAEGLDIIGGGFDFKIETFEAAIDDCHPEVVILDGAYLLKVSGGSRIEQAANSFNEIKRICKRKKVPIIVTTQLNRDAKKNVSTTIQAENIALTDVAQWNADLIFGLLQSEEMRQDKRLIIKPLKVREGVCRDVEVNWDFDRMDFSELPYHRGSFGDSDELGTGVSPFGKKVEDDDLPF